MNDSTLIRISLCLALIGIVVLYFISENKWNMLENGAFENKKVGSALNKNVISGIIIKIYTGDKKSSIYLENNPAQIIIFKSADEIIELKIGDNIKAIGDYNDKDFIAEEIIK